MRFRGMPEPLLAVAVAGTRIFDRWFGTRTSIYGWAFYFGSIKDPIDVHPSPNVCIRCGQAYPAHELQATARVKKGLLLRSYACPNCGATNYFFT
jgi:DNA-directed RNA polymerase subunit RPC12/RpoP